MSKWTQQLPTLLVHQCLELLRLFAHGLEKFDRFQRLCENSQQHVTTCDRVTANGHNM